MLARAVLVIGAVAAIAFSAIWLHQSHLLSEARRAAFAPGATTNKAQVAHVTALFQRARAHTPDSLPAMYEALFLFEAGQRARAAALAGQVVRREPRNVSAWSLLGQADPPRAGEARARILELNPLAARGSR
jgi:predicted Zn-dependent protease